MAVTPVRHIRIPDTDWSRLDDVADDAGISRARLVTDLIRLYLAGEITSPLLPPVTPPAE